jgi:hypothetical protein
MLMELKEVKRTNPMRSKNMHDSRESNERCTNPNTDVHIQSIIHKAQVIFFILKKGVISNAQGFHFCGESI